MQTGVASDVSDRPKESFEHTFQSLYREQFGRVVASTARVTKDIALAEDVAQDTFVKASELWRKSGIPLHAVAWLMKTARNASIDLQRRDQRLHEMQADLAGTDALVAEVRDAVADSELDSMLEDDMLRLVFTCAHPALNIDARVALCLSVVCGLRTEEIARAFLVTDATMAQRLWRAKVKIKNAGIAYRSPEASELEERLTSALAVIYLIFNEGWLASSGDVGSRQTLVQEAIRLGRLLAGLLPQASEPSALLALMILQNARRDARFTDQGELVLLPDQDRSLWHRAEIREGITLVEQIFRANKGNARYAILAAIAAVHAQSNEALATNWEEIIALYGYLMKIDPSPVVALNHAVAVGEGREARLGLQLMDALSTSKAMQRYHLYHASKAEMLHRCHQNAEAIDALECAISCCPDGVEKRFLRNRQQQLQTGKNL